MEKFKKVINYNDIVVLDDIDLLSENIDTYKYNSFSCGGYLDKSINDDINRLDRLDTYAVNDLFKGNNNKPLSSIVFFADKPKLAIKGSILEEEFLGLKILTSNERKCKLCNKLYKLLKECDSCTIYDGHNSISCKLIPCLQHDDKSDEGEEVFYVLQYTIKCDNFEFGYEYNELTKFHNDVLIRLCKKLGNFFEIMVYPYYITYDVNKLYLSYGKQY